MGRNSSDINANNVYKVVNSKDDMHIVNKPCLARWVHAYTV